MKFKSIACAVALFCLSGVAMAESQALTPDAIDKALLSPKAIKPVPFMGFYMVETDSGTWLVSDDRRMVVTDFKAIDLMSGKPIQRIADMDLLKKADFKKMGIDVAKMSTLAYGKGDKRVTVFVDPKCSHCHRLMAQMTKLTDEYTFDLVLLPVLGPLSIEQSTKIWCQKDRVKATEALVMSDIKAISEMKVPEECDMSVFRKSEEAASILGVRGTPFIVTHAMTLHRGGTEDLAGLLKADK